MKQPSPGLILARERFAQRFKKAVLARIAQQEEERASRSPAEISAERDALIGTLAAAGRSLSEIITATESKADYVREVLGLSLEDVQRQQRERERDARKARGRAAPQPAL